MNFHTLWISTRYFFMLLKQFSSTLRSERHFFPKFHYCSNFTLFIMLTYSFFFSFYPSRSLSFSGKLLICFIPDCLLSFQRPALTHRFYFVTHYTLSHCSDFLDCIFTFLVETVVHYQELWHCSRFPNWLWANSSKNYSPKLFTFLQSLSWFCEIQIRMGRYSFGWEGGNFLCGSLYSAVLDWWPNQCW